MIRQFKSIFIDISGICNANCPYCLSGRYRGVGGKYITSDVFEQVLERLTTLKLMESSTVLGLYNWGEPFLHPQLDELLQIANSYKINYSFSTNASIVPKINKTFVYGLKEIIFSISGFSQSSYDRIHGFDFAKICTNIQMIVDQMRSAGYEGAFRIHYHVYQFNLNEIVLCEEFTKRLGIDFRLHYAILNHWDHLWAYVADELPNPKLKEVSQDLFSFRLRSITPNSIIESYQCPQYDLLAIDENANVLLCCQVPNSSEYIVGNILHDDIEEIQQKRVNSSVCINCIERGMARYLNTSLAFPLLRGENKQSLVHRFYRKILNYFG